MAAALSISPLTLHTTPTRFLKPHIPALRRRSCGPIAAAASPELRSISGVEDSVGVLKLAAKTRRVPSGEVLTALGVMKMAQGPCRDGVADADRDAYLHRPDLEWKLVYVGSAKDETYDQVLESVLVGPVNVGTFRFIFEADPVDISKIRDDDIIGVTVLLLTCSYAGQEFLRIGYYVNNDYDDEQLREEPPQKVLIDRVQRNILADKPCVTKFPINFHPEIGDNGAEQAQDILFEEQLLPPTEQSIPLSEQSLPLPEQTLNRT